MAGNNIDRKLRFLPFLPYGFCSKTATTMKGRYNPYARQLFLGEDPTDLEKQNEQERKRVRAKAKDLCHKKYALDANLMCGTPAEERSFRRMTKAGLAVLVEATDEAMNDETEEADSLTEINGELKGAHFRARSASASELREELTAYASDKTELGQTIFDEILLDAVTSGMTTPLTYSIGLIKSATLRMAKYSPNQLYNIWRLSHINAMFAANGHLTYMDRRPYDTGFAIDGINSEETYAAYVQKHGLTVPAITYNALTNWYRKNPGFFRFTQRKPDYTEETRQRWLNTPAYYAAKELPSKKEQGQTTDSAEGNGSKQKIKTIHVGLATGKNGNFACYHGKPGPFKWYKPREEHSKNELESAVHEMKTQNPELPFRNTVDYAAYFITTRHQFDALFARTREKHIENKKLPQATEDPYASIHIIPVNDSGAFELWCLLEYGPKGAEAKIHNNLIAADDDFSYRPDYCFPLTYDDKPVFSGYTMDLYKIQHALEDHLDGLDFYVACFPEQAPLYRSLFPGKIIL